jgi:prepilin peptidase CpaA
MNQLIVAFILPCMLAYACFSDLFTMKLTNRLCIAMIGLFIVFAAANGFGFSQLLPHISAFAVVLVFSFGMFAMGWIGGGDAKFVACTALWIGMGHVVDYVAFSAALGGLLTLLLISWRKMPLPAGLMFQPWIARLHEQDSGVPYGAALGPAALLVLPTTPIWAMLI